MPPPLSCRDLERLVDECLATRARLVGRVVTDLFDDRLRSLRLRVTQMGILVAIGAGRAERATDVARALCLERSTVSRNLERMIEQGWLESCPDEDARSRRLRLTAAGRRLLGRALPAWRTAQRETRALLGARGADALERLARRAGFGGGAG